MSHQQPHLLTPPTRNHDLQQTEQIPEKLAIDFDFLPRAIGFFVQAARPWSAPQLDLLLGGSLLLRDSIMDSFGEGGKEGQIDSSGDLRPVTKIGGC